MYTLVSALAKERHWVIADLSQLTLNQIENNYEEAYLRVSSPFWAKDRTMLFSEVTKDYAQRDSTLAQFFTNIGNQTLPSTDGLASISSGSAKYADAYWAGYTVKAGRINGNPNTPVRPSEADTIILSKPGVDGRIFHKNCLVSVNGILHRCDADADNVYVLEGGRSNYHSKRNEVGIINFIKVGEISYHSITKEMLFKAHEQQPFANQIFIKTPFDTTGKTVALVFGGYLHLMDNLTFFRVGENSFCIDVQSIALLERFIESRHLIDLSALGLDYNGKHKAQFSREQLYSDDVLMKWLGLSQSYLLVIDSPDVVVDRVALAPVNLAKQYLVYKDTTLPMTVGFGLIAPYWKYEDDNVFSYSVGNKIRPNYLFRSTPIENVPMPADNEIPYNPQSYSIAHFLDIASEKIVIIPNS